MLGHNYSNVVSNKIFYSFISCYYIMNNGYCIDYSYYKANSKSISQWIDYLRLVNKGSINLWESLWIDIDEDNSNFAIINIGWFDLTIDRSVVKGSWDWYKFSIDYNGFSTPLFMVRYYKTLTLLDFYGSFFRLVDIQYLPSNYIESILVSLGVSFNCSISRIDYRLDFLSDSSLKIQWVHNVLKHNINTSSIRSWKKWQVLTNWQCGDKNSKAVVFRLYDKFIDSKKKHKEYLYTDYFRFDSVHRLEFECNLKFCRWFTFNDLNLLLDKIYRVFWISENQRIWKILYRYDKNKLVYTKKEISTYFSNIRKNIDYLTSNYIASNLNSDLNPLSIVFDYIKQFNYENKKLTDYLWIEFREYRKTYCNKTKGKNKNL